MWHVKVLLYCFCLSFIHPAQKNSAVCCVDVKYWSLNYRTGHMDMSKWKKLDSRSLGVHRSQITEPSRIVLNILRKEGKNFL